MNMRKKYRWETGGRFPLEITLSPKQFEMLAALLPEIILVLSHTQVTSKFNPEVQAEQ